MNFNKALTSVVSVSLIIVIVIVSIIGFQSWFQNYSSNKYIDAELKSNSMNKIIIQDIIGNKLYLRNDLKDNLTLDSIKIGDNICDFSTKNINLGLHIIELNNCFNDNSKIINVLVITDNEVLESQFYNNLDKESSLSNSPVVNISNAILNINVLSPNSNIEVVQNSFFDISFNVSCLNDNCGELEVSLDPTIYKIAVIPSDKTEVASILNQRDDLEAYAINEADLDESYDAVVCIRCAPGSYIENYVESGYGGYVGEWDSNDFPYSQGWITGTSSIGNSGGNSLNSLNNENNYLYSAIDWNSIPYGAGPVDFMRDITNNDPESFVIATVNHNSYGVIPFVVVKANPYGDGNIVIANSDWKDDPDYNVALVDAIQKWAYYAAKDSVISLGELISTEIGATPFYTNAENPQIINLNKDESQIVTFSVNATGEINKSYDFFGFINSTINYSVNNVSNHWTVKIIQ